MKHKQYLYVDIGNLKEHVFHQEGREKIVLPEKMRVALNSIFNAKQDAIFGDLFHGRHGGIVVLANGPSGVGKTLTAEVFAEYQKRPLYTMEMGEIGTSLKEVEANLQRIFARAKKWNAVLLFDEADIFLSERVASDLERSAIVGIFLRLLDYYEGTFFLTTNRGDGIDKAFKSRVTLYLDYPELSPEIRKIIWTNMLGAAAIEVTEDASWDVVSKAPLNGRQIRNQVRLLKLMYPDNKVKTSSIMESLEFTTR
jgi:SpoVK/Ycf46/Vps4 family AAA+-type ATPase